MFAVANPHCEYLGYILCAFLNEQESHHQRQGVGTFCLQSWQSWGFCVTEPCLRWKLPEILNRVWRLQNLSHVTKQMK